jgi:hypothetical protein
MKKKVYQRSAFILLIFTLILLNNPVFSQYGKNNDGIRGLTSKPISTEEIIINGKAEEYKPKELPQKFQTVENTFNSDWQLIDKIDLDMCLEAGLHHTIYFDKTAAKLQQIEQKYINALTANAQAAVQKAPKWLRKELTWTFTKLSASNQDLWAGAIINAVDPYIDEVAFSIAHSSPQYLSSGYGSPELFLENARLIYQADSLLDYVRVVDYGTSANYDDYYSSTRYYSERDLVKYEFRVPKMIYYWYIVHPKITDEIPAYINPGVIESNSSHNNNIAQPPVGKFWRDYLFNSSDSGYPVLKELLKTSTFVWNGSSSIGSTSAIDVITNWINASMSFTSNNERPHQPVRIYKKHIGRCGEYADIVAAVCRAALIPCTSILSTSSDHTWNEFWDEGWIHYEPVNSYINKPTVYEDGWNKVFGALFEIRSDGYLTSVIKTYQTAEPASINIFVKDKNGVPVDGAKIRLACRQTGTASYYWDFYTLTDNEGKCLIPVGDDNDYFVKVESKIGSSNVLEVASNVKPGDIFNISIPLTGTMPSYNCTITDVPQASNGRYKLVVDFTSPYQMITGDIWLDDIDNSTCFTTAPSGKIDFMMTDETNYNNFKVGSAFNTFNMFKDANEVQAEFNIPSDGNWYCVFNNIRNLNNPQYLAGTVELYGDATVFVQRDSDQLPEKFILSQNYPNPFNPGTVIQYTIKTECLVTIKVFNILGQEVRTLVNDIKSPGNYEIYFNAAGLSDGTYVYRMQAGNYSVSRKMIVLK